MSVYVKLPDGEKTHFVQTPDGVRNLHIQVPPVPPEIFFSDNFGDTATLGSDLNSRTSSGKNGVWRNTSYTTETIVCRANHVIGGIYAVPPKNDLTICTAWAEPKVDIAKETNLRVLFDSHIKLSGGYGTGHFAFANYIAGVSLWNTTSYKSGLTFYREIPYIKYQSPPVNNHLYIDGAVLDTIIHHEPKTTNYISPKAFVPVEIHTEKLSETKLKAGIKMYGSWIKNPYIYTVPNGFFTTPNRVALILRNNQATIEGGFCKNFVIDDKIDW